MKQGYRKLLSLFSLLALVFASVAASAVFAQTETGQINGTITDSSGGAVTGAKIIVRNLGTGAEHALESDSNGYYSITSLQLGTYSIHVEAPNLEKVEKRAEVTVGGKIELNFSLTVGTGTVTVVEVTGEGGVEVNTETATIGTVIDGAKVNEMPSLNRNPYDFAGKVGTASDMTPDGRGVGVSFNGMRAASTNVLLDGAANNDEFGGDIGQAVPLDSVAEYSVLTNNFTAEYGRASGGIVNLATKSGTNDYHGSAYEYNRVSDLAANDFLDNAQGNPRGHYTRNQFGFSGGGPVIKNKLFFFTNFEWNRIRSDGNQTVYIIDPAFVAASDPKTQAYFSQLGTTRSNLTTLGVVTVGDVNCGAGAAVATGSCAALPTNTPFLDQVSYQVPSDAGAGAPENELLGLVRGDWTVSDKTSVYVRWALEKDTFFPGTNNTSAYAGFDTGSTITNNNTLISMTHTFTPQTTSQSKVVFNRLNNLQPLANIPPATTLYFNNAVETFYTTPLGQSPVQLPGYSSLTPGNGIPFGGPQNFLQGYQDFSTGKGRHTFRYGGSYNYQRDNRTFGAYENPVGALARTGGVSNASINNLLDGQLAVFQGAINPQGNFPCPYPITPGMPCTNPDTGVIDTQGNVITPVGAPVFARSNRYQEFAFYGADQWKATNRLTVSLGLRWEYFGIQHDKNPNLDSNFYFGAGSNIFEQIRNGGVATVPTSPIDGLWKKDWNNFGPKLGFAYDIFGNGKTVLRGGYSIAYERNFGNVTFNVIQNPPNYSVISLIAGVDVPSIDITADPAGPLAGSGTVKAIPKVSLRAVNPNIVSAYAHLYSLTLEHQLTHNVVIGLDFSGSKGVHLYDIANINRPGAGNIYLGDDPNTEGLTRLDLQQYSNINYRSDDGTSRYNALVARIGTKNWKGLTFNANYTYSHSLDELSDTFSSSANQFNLGYLDPFNPKIDYGNSYADLRHRFTLQGIWEIPFAKNTHGWEKQALDGWALSPVFTAESGAPFSIFDCTNAVTVCMYGVNAAGTSGLPRTRSGKLQDVGVDDFLYTPFYSSYDNAGNPTGAPLFDSSYVNPIVGISDFGPYPALMNARNNFRGPGQRSFDLAAFKTFHIGERYNLIFRAEAYNVFNHANLLLNGGDSDVAEFNFVDASKGGAPRTLQFALRFQF